MGLPGITSVLGRSSIVRFGAVFSAAYLGWLFLFERFLEPQIRRVVAAVVGRPIVWVSAHVGLRIWGLRGRHPRKAEAAVSLCGALIVVSSAFFPAIAATLAARVAALDSALSASVYLISPPMAAIFVYHVLSRSPEGS